VKREMEISFPIPKVEGTLKYSNPIKTRKRKVTRASTWTQE